MSGNLFHRVPRGVLALVALLALGSVAGALIAQHVFGMQPCPWCIFQRVLYLAIGAVALLGWATPVRQGVLPSALLVLLLSSGGVAAAVFQHQVASKDASCSLTFADRFLSATGLEAMLPALFQVTASCIQAASYRLLGLPFEVWSGALFAAIAVMAALLLWHWKPRA
jgi:disulfide bond formation protein DsbB